MKGYCSVCGDPSEVLYDEDKGLLCESCRAVLHTPLVIGLRAQGHIPTIEQMLAEGASWPEIGREIGWCPDTAREWYERDVATTGEENRA